jgi:hypothetical protein
MACPICVSPEGTAMTAGMQAGAIVLIAAAAIVVSVIARFACRLWRLAAAGADRAETTDS